MRWVAAAVGCLVIAASSTARADAVPPPPADCPAGSVGETGHDGTYCRATSCETDADCKKVTRWNDKRSYVCREQPLCIEETEVSSWRSKTPQRRVIGKRSCDPDGACVRPETCQTAKRCVLAALAEAEGEDGERGSSKPAPKSTPGKCDCAAPSASSTPSLWLLSPLFVAAALRRATTRSR